jgi:hypothetical protein
MIRMGIEGQLFYGAAGSTATTLANNVKDLTEAIDPQEADLSARGSVIEQAGPGTIKLTISWNSNWDPADAFILACIAAATTRTPMALRTKDYSAGKGVDGDFILTKLDHKEPLKEGQAVDFEARPTPLGGRWMTAAQLYC